MKAKSFVGAVQLVISIAIAVVWLQSATAHLGNPYLFLATIYKYKLVGTEDGYWLAVTLPTVQFVLAICLLSRVLVGGALFASAVLFIVFSAVQLSAASRGIEIDCGCFGPGNSTPIGLKSITTVSAFAGLALIGSLCHVYVSKKRTE